MAPQKAADKKHVMTTLSSIGCTEFEIRFLEYRLEVVSDWPASERKRATVEAISRRLAAIAQWQVGTANDDLLALSCHLLEDVFAGALQKRVRV